MNLWVKRTMQLLGVALLFASCEDDSFLLGFKNKNSRFKGIYQEIALTTSEVISMDSVYTDGPVGGRLLLGEYFDNILGTVRAEAYTEFGPSNPTRLLPASSTKTVH
jgi:hypothetical protein